MHHHPPRGADATATAEVGEIALTDDTFTVTRAPVGCGPPVEPTVVVTNSLAEPDRIVVLEGHVRLTRFIAAGHRLVEPVERSGLSSLRRR